MTHKIAIILTREIDIDGGDYNSYSQKIIDTISDWTEVSDHDFELLKRAQTYDYHHRFTLIERPLDEPTFIKKTVADYVKWATAEEAKRLAAKQKAEQDAAARKLKKLAKDRAAKEKLLEELKKELGVEEPGKPMVMR